MKDKTVDKKKKNKTTKCFPSGGETGFTLIEIVLAMTLVAMVFLAIYSIYAQTIKYDTESRYEIIAAGLAQEGVEMIRNIRDENVLNGYEINEGLSNGTVCHPKVDSSGNVLCNKGGSAYVYLQGSEGYSHYENDDTSDIKTPFKRKCEIDRYDDNDAFTVTCTVEWNSFARSDLMRKVEAKSVLTDWLKE